MPASNIYGKPIEIQTEHCRNGGTLNRRRIVGEVDPLGWEPTPPSFEEVERLFHQRLQNSSTLTWVGVVISEKTSRSFAQQLGRKCEVKQERDFELHFDGTTQ